MFGQWLTDSGRRRWDGGGVLIAAALDAGYRGDVLRRHAPRATGIWLPRQVVGSTVHAPRFPLAATSPNARSARTRRRAGTHAAHRPGWSVTGCARRESNPQPAEIRRGLPHHSWWHLTTRPTCVFAEQERLRTTSQVPSVTSNPMGLSVDAEFVPSDDPASASSPSSARGECVSGRSPRSVTVGWRWTGRGLDACHRSWPF